MENKALNWFESQSDLLKRSLTLRYFGETLDDKYFFLTNEEKYLIYKIETEKQNVYHLLSEMLTEFEYEYQKELNRVSEHNNSDWVGIKFDYLNNPTIPSWVEKARKIFYQNL